MIYGILLAVIIIFLLVSLFVITMNEIDKVLDYLFTKDLYKGD